MLQLLIILWVAALVAPTKYTARIYAHSCPPPPTPYLPPCCCCCCCWCFTPLSAVVLALLLLLLLLQFAYLQKVQGRTPKEPLALLELLTNLFGQHTRPSRQSPVSSHHHRNSRSHSDSRSACPSSSPGLLFSSSNYGRVQGSISVRFFGFRFSVLSLIVGLVSLSVPPSLSPSLPLSLFLSLCRLASICFVTLLVFGFFSLCCGDNMKGATHLRANAGAADETTDQKASKRGSRGIAGIGG